MLEKISEEIGRLQSLGVLTDLEKQILEHLERLHILYSINRMMDKVDMNKRSK